MTRKLITIGPEDSVEKASALMAKHKIKRLPVVSSGNLEGIISVTDIIANSKNVDSDFLLE
ncbi:MAG: CBS domain-containing protein [Candidatus Pacearchaeota archaeon]